MNQSQSIRRIPLLMAIVAMAAAIFAPQANAAFGPPTFSFSFGSEGLGNGQLKSPEDGIAFDSAGNAWISDTANGRVQKFDSKGKYLAQFGSIGSGNGQFDWPRDIAIDAAGNLWVVDSRNHRVQKFNSKGEYLSQFGTKGTGNGQLEQPGGIALDGLGNIWVTDSLNKRVQKFNSKGEYVSQFGSSGSGNGQFESLGDVDIDTSGNLLVADTGNHRVQKFNSKGEYLSQFGTKGSGNGQFSSPRGIALDSQGRIWVADRTNRRVQAFSSAGEYLTQFGSKGSGNGQFESSPTGLGFDPNGNLWVGDTGNHRVQVFTRLWRIGGKTFAELGITEESLETSGSWKIEFPNWAITLLCTQTAGSGTLTSSGPTTLSITLKCEMSGKPTCVIEPVKMIVNGSFSSLEKNLTTLKFSPSCGFITETAILVNGTGSFGFGTEAVKLPVTAYHSTTFGTHPVVISGSVYWNAAGKYAGKTLGVW